MFTATSLVLPYTILLALLVHNLIVYVIRQRMFQQVHITLFYVISLATVTTRMGYIVSVIATSKLLTPYDEQWIGMLFSIL